MSTSKLIAGLMGPTLVLMAAGLLLNLRSFSVVIEPVSRDPALIFISGVLSFVAGLAIVRIHNRWTRNWTVIITVLGWLALLTGVLRVLFPLWLASMAVRLSLYTSAFAAEAVVFLLVGAFLSFKAYGRGR